MKIAPVLSCVFLLVLIIPLSINQAEATSLSVTVSSHTNVVCNGYNNATATATVSGGTSPYTYAWSTNPTQVADTATGLSAGTYTVGVVDASFNTASATVTITQPSPLTLITLSTYDSSNCNGTATVVASGGTSPYTYLWSQGGTSAFIGSLCIGTYCCVITDSHGCTKTNCVTVSNCANNYAEPICMVTIDTATNKCMILWGRTKSPPSGGYGNYIVYRDTGAGYNLIHSQALNVLSEYIDTSSNPSSGPISYELSTIDSCGESALSSTHTSIYLTVTIGHSGYILNWTAYVGFSPSKYIIFRGPSLSKLTAIDSVANNVLTYQDMAGPLGSFYVVEAEDPNGVCIPSAHRPDKSSISLLSGALSNWFNTDVLGINNVENNIANLKVYPNPSNGMFTLNYSMNGSDNVTISIINELGQQVYVEQKHANNGSVTEQLNVENLASGIYTLRIQTSKGISVSKLSIMQNR